jgi:hypothetical protein
MKGSGGGVAVGASSVVRSEPMSDHRNTPPIAFVGAATVAATAVVVAVATPSAAHTHPTPIERAAPAVVFVEARATIEVALIEHRTSADAAGVHIGVTQSTWNPVLATASGFAVDPNGAIVTSGAVAKPDLRRAQVYAVNHAFATKYGQSSLTARPFERQHMSTGNSRDDERLQACYPPQRMSDAGGCIVRASLDMVVYPYVTSQQRYGNLRAQVLAGSPEVAVLGVRGANGWPTVPVAQSPAGSKALGVLGFTGVPSAQHPLKEVNQHFAQPGGPQLKSTNLDAQDVKDAAALKQLLGQGFAGGPVVAESGQVVGLLAGPAPTGRPVPDLVGVTAIRPVLQRAGVTPRDGPVDYSYERAMHSFKNGDFRTAIPYFKQALAVFPGHYRARTNLTTAEQRLKGGAGATASATAASGSSASAPQQASSGERSWLLPVAVVVAALLLVGAVGLLARRSVNRRPGPTGAHASGRPPVPAGGERPVPTAAGARRDASRGPPAQTSRATAGRPGATAAAAPRVPAGGGPDAARHTDHAVAPSTRPVADRRVSHTAGAREASAPAPRSAVKPSTTSAHAAPPRTGPRPAPSGAATGAGGPGTGNAQPSEQQAAPSASTSAAGYRFCTSCGGRLAAQHQFCGWCGAPVH